MRADHLVAGEELRLRHQAAAAREAARARRHLRVRPADRRHRRRHPAGSAGRHARRAEDRRPGGRPPGRPQPRRGQPRRPRAARAGRRQAQLPGPDGGVRGTHRRLRGRRPRHPLRDVRGPAPLLPLRGRLDRTAVAGHLRHRARSHGPRPAGGGPPGRLARRGPAADQHPARHPRGPRERAGLPARRGPGQVRHRPGRTQRVPVHPAGGIRSRTGPRMVRRRLAVAADARPPQRGLHRRHGRHLPPAARADRGAARRRPGQPGFLVHGGESHGRGAGPGGKDQMSFKVAVIGGGLAGITAAIALAESGADVTLLEARPRLGGATCSFSRDGLTVDTGQHIFLGCCSAYRGLLDRLGVTGHTTLQDRFDVTVLAPGGKKARLRRTALPGPLHMLPALGRYPFLSRTERAKVARPALAMRFVDPADPAADTQRFGDWLARRGQSERTRRALWDLFSVSALNIAGDDASLALAAVVIKTGLLGRNNAADIGVPTLPLGELHGDAGATLLAKLGGQVALSTKVSAIEPVSGGGFRIALAQGDPVTADAVVLAVPHEKAAPLIPAGVLPEQTVAGWAGLGASPIVNVHVIYDRPVMDQPFVAAIDSPVQWVFDRTRISGMDRPGHQYLAISLSAADQYADTPVAQLQEQFVPALAELFPAARDATVAEFFVTRERRATFRQAPGSGALRPKAATRRPGLVLAGAWTDTGWPDTMEGAVRSGLSAAVELRRSVLTTASKTGASTIGERQ